MSQVQRVLPFILTVAAFLLASLGQALLNRRVNEEAAVALFAVAIVLTLIAFLRPHEGKKAEKAPPSRWDLGGMLSLLVASIPAWVASILLMLRWDYLPTAVPLYIWSVALVGAVCSRRDDWAWPRFKAIREHWIELTLVILVLGFGLFLRLDRLDYYPPPGGISWNDEAQIGKDAYGIIRHGYLPWQFPVSVYSTYLSFRAVGATVFALRLPFVLLGFLTLIVFYLLARELFHFPVALTATFLFAVSRWHIAFTRLVLPSTPAMLLEVATFYLLLRGRRTGGMMNYILAGLTMSVGLYSHASFRMVPILVLFLLVGEIWTLWRSGEDRPVGLVATLSYAIGSRWMAFLVAAALFAAPFLAVVRREPYRAFGERFSVVMPVLFGAERAAHLGGLLHRAQQSLGFFNYRGEAWGAVNLPDLPMLDPWTGVLFALGFGYCLFYFWRNRHLFYLAWFLITVIGGGVLTLDFRSHRFAGVMPVLFIFAGVFVEGAWATFRRTFGSSRGRCFALILVPVLVLAGYANYDIFFQRQIHADSVRVEFTREVSAIANYMASLGDGHYFYLFANHAYYTPGMDFAWMAGEPPGERALGILDVIPSHTDTGDDELVYIFSTPYDVEALTDVVRFYYPGARIETFQGEYDRYTFVSARVEAEMAREAQGLMGSYYAGYHPSEEPDMVQKDAQLSFDWSREDPPLPFPFRAEWRGTIYAPEEGTYVFETEATGRAQVHVDDQPLQDGKGVQLVKGWHALGVVYASTDEAGGLRLLWRTPQGDREMVPPRFLSPREEVNGLLVTVFEGPDWRGQPVQQSIEPVIYLVRVPSAWQSAFIPELAGKLYSLDCQGQLKVDQAGPYGFQIVAWNGNADLYVDGQEVVTVGGTRTISGRGEVELTPGWHEIRLRYSYQGGEFSGVQLSWTPRGGETRIIPPAALRPAGHVAERARD